MAVAADHFARNPLEWRGALRPGFDAILTPAALEFLSDLQRRFGLQRNALLAARAERHARFDAGELPDFLPATQPIRNSDWTVAPIPAAVCDRRIELTGPVERKTIINALNSGANVFMADFEDATSPTWDNLIEGQINLRDAVAGTIDHHAPDGRVYRLGDDPAVLMVRPRGLHFPERHLLVDCEPIAASFVDFGLYVFHNAAALQARERGPYLYLPKLESHQEAALWDEILAFSEEHLGLPHASIKATVLIETVPAAFEMDEILYALRSRVIGLNCGRWDYIFSYIKTFRAHADRVLPERGQIGMDAAFLKNYSDLLINTCHRRGALALGGIAAQIPISGDAQANEAALDQVRADKLREARAGHDGTGLAHPGLIPLARQIFDAHMPGANQLQVARDPRPISRDDLIAPAAGTITRAGLLNNIDVCVRYLAAWLDGHGCVPIHHLMEDAATAEIARAQLWQWLHFPERAGGRALTLEDGSAIDFSLFDAALQRIGERLPRRGLPGQSRLTQAAWLLAELTHARALTDFLTLTAYPHLA